MLDMERYMPEDPVWRKADYNEQQCIVRWAKSEYIGRIKGIFTSDELKAACSEYYLIDTDNNERAGAILTNDCGIGRLEVMEDGKIRIYDGLDDIRSISKKLYENGVIPTELSLNEVNLEDYYMKLVKDSEEKDV